MPPQRCCVCRFQGKGRTYPTNDLEAEFSACFGVNVADRVSVNDLSRICGTCYGCIVKFRKDGIIRHDRLDCKGKRGQHGHKAIGGKRQMLSLPVTPQQVTTGEQSPSTSHATTSSIGVGTDLEGHHLDATRRKLDLLTKCSTQEPLNRHQEILFHQMTTSIVNTQASGKHLKNYQTRPRQGLGHKVLVAPRTRVSSAECCRQTRNNRSEAVEEFQRHMACESSASEEQLKQSLTVQRTTMFKRGGDEYSTALEAAGFKVYTKFSRETVLDLRSRMPMTAWQYVKRALKNELGINLMGTERELREEISALEFEYECVSFKDTSNDKGSTIHAIRATNVSEVITRTVKGLHDSRQLETLSNCPQDTLWIHISGDKGGKSTKLLLQVINASNRHSIKSAKLLGMFEGGKDNRNNIEMSFKPIFEQLKQLAADFPFDLTCPPNPGELFITPESRPEDEQMQNTLQPLNGCNQTVSQDCSYCKNSTSIPAEPSSNVDSPSDDDKKFKNLRVTFGGDWEWLARLMGLSGPSGRQFCIHCLATRPELLEKKGMSYGLHELGNGVNDKPQDPDVLQESSHNLLRTYEGCKMAHQRYMEAGAENVLNFHNCKQEPLNWDIGLILDSISTTPLHVSLGLGLQNVNAIENMAMEMDKEVKEAEGESSDELDGLMAERTKQLQTLENLRDEKETLQRQVVDTEEREQELRNNNPAHFLKENRTFVEKGRNAKASRATLKTLVQEKNTLKTAIKALEKNTLSAEKNLESVMSSIEKCAGPFKVRFDDTMNALKLKRVVYHSGALIGPDVYKTLQPASIQRFGAIFEPLELNTKTAGKQVFGSLDMVQRVTNLLSKFRACYVLYTKNAVLCKHEVEQLCLNIMEFGTWFPCNFPTVSLTPKFHMMTVEMPRQVRRMFTIGMLTEQVSESIHPYVNKLERMFASTRDIGARQRLTMRQHNILSGV